MTDHPTSDHPTSVSPDPTDARAVLLTGAAGGVGTALTRELLAQGYVVYAAARQVDDPRLIDHPRVRPVALDVTDPTSIDAAARAVTAAQGDRGLYAVVNNAGVIVQGPLELASRADLQHQFDVNVIGPALVLGTFLPMLRAGGGRVVNISAATARVAVPFMGPISASKAALESLSDALRVELAAWGIPVTVVEPGAMDTTIFAKASHRHREAQRELTPEQRALYDDALAATAKATASMSLQPVATVVAPVVAALAARRPKARYVSGSDARNLVRLGRMPVRVRDRLLIRTLGLKDLCPAGPAMAGEPYGSR